MDRDQDGLEARPRVFQACVPCGKRKTKCDGHTPVCHVCETRNRECSYAPPRSQKRPRTEDSSIHVETPTTRHTMSIPSNTVPTQSPTVPQTRHPVNLRLRGPRAEVSGRVSPSTGGINRIVPRSEPSFQQASQDASVDSDVTAYLFNIYFNVIHPVWPVLYKPLFDSTNFKLLEQGLPKPLLYAICALAACVPREESRTSASLPPSIPASSTFFKAATLAIQSGRTSDNDDLNSLYPVQLLQSSVEICQALTILALQQQALGDSVNAYRLCSRAATMAIDLKLHKPSPSNTDPTDSQVKSRLWWNIYVLDKVIACELGTPVLLRNEDSNADFPSSSESDEYQLLILREPDSNNPVSIKSYTMSGFGTTIQLAMTIEQLLHQVYSLRRRETNRVEMVEGGNLRLKLWDDLKSYDETLHNSRFSLEKYHAKQSLPPPVGVTCTVWLWTAMILLHRPFYHYWQDQDPRYLGELSANGAMHPLEVCCDAAERICQIVEGHVSDLFKYPCNLLFPIFTAASTLAHYSEQKKNVTEERRVENHLDMCIRWLSILGRNVKDAKAFNETMISDPKPSLTFGRTTSLPETSAQSPLPQSSSTGVQRRDPDLLANSSEIAHPVSLLQQLGNPGQDYEWAFLDELGDPADEFYALDVEFRESLRKQLITGGIPKFVVTMFTRLPDARVTDENKILKDSRK